MPDMRPMEKAPELVKDFTEEGQRFANKMSRIQAAYKARKPSDLSSLHSQVVSGVSSDPCHIKDLELDPCPPGSQHLGALKTKAKEGQEQCIQTMKAADDKLGELMMEAGQIDVAQYVSSLQSHREAELARLEKEKILCAQVAGPGEDIKGRDEILQDEGVSLDLSEAAKTEKHEALKWQRIQRFCGLGPEVANALISRGKLPANLDAILAVSEQCGSVDEIGQQASQIKKEGENVLKKLTAHSDADLIFKIERLICARILCFLCFLCFLRVLC